MLKYHQFRAALGMGDLHPGGLQATEEILRLLSANGARRVLEVGAGIGNTALRMLARGWEVTALEPDAVLFSTLQSRLGARARCEAFLAHATSQGYDAIVAESVFCMLDLDCVFFHARQLLRPGGYLAFVDAVWSDTVSSADSRAWHDNTLRLFGLPVGSRERLTWQDWCGRARAAGFRTLYNVQLPRGAAGAAPTPGRRTGLGGLLRKPALLACDARYRLRKRRARIPAEALESWIYFGQRDG
jgi:SAM-dependent methyltransferase